jgi:hypothetical protein
MGKAATPTRINRTITVDFQNEATYFQLLDEVVYLCAAGNSDGPVQRRSCRESAGHEHFNRDSGV